MNYVDVALGVAILLHVWVAYVQHLELVKLRGVVSH